MVRAFSSTILASSALIVLLMSASRLLRFSARMSSAARWLAWDAPDQLTSIQRLGSVASRLMQSALWMDTPEPVVMKPMIASPGTG